MFSVLLILLTPPSQHTANTHGQITKQHEPRVNMQDSPLHVSVGLAKTLLSHVEVLACVVSE